MKEKLTLSIDKETKQRAKHHAHETGRSVSQMVQDFLDAVVRESPTNEQEILQQQALAEAGIEDWAKNISEWE
jgi:antitoxin component of RelBE/YafQ-DinJ toxin-antitoxin module